MAQISEWELRRGLQNFEAVWRRVGAGRSPRETAERCGVKLMPRKGCRGRQACGPRGTKRT